MVQEMKTDEGVGGAYFGPLIPTCRKYMFADIHSNTVTTAL